MLDKGHIPKFIWLRILWQRDFYRTSAKLVKSSCLGVYWKKGFLKKFSKFTEVHLRWIPFFDKVASLRQVRLFCIRKVLENIKCFVGKVHCRNIVMKNLIEKQICFNILVLLFLVIVSDFTRLANGKLFRKIMVQEIFFVASCFYGG